MGHVFQFYPTKFTETRNVLREVSEEASTPKPPTQHPRDNNTFVDFVAGDCSAPHRMRMTEGHELGFEKFQRLFFKSGTVRTKFGLPIICDVALDQVSEGLLTKWVLEEQEGMRKVVGIAVGSDVSKPIFTTLA